MHVRCSRRLGWVERGVHPLHSIRPISTGSFAVDENAAHLSLGFILPAPFSFTGFLRIRCYNDRLICMHIPKQVEIDAVTFVEKGVDTDCGAVVFLLNDAAIPREYHLHQESLWYSQLNLVVVSDDTITASWQYQMLSVEHRWWTANETRTVFFSVKDRFHSPSTTTQNQRMSLRQSRSDLCLVTALCFQFICCHVRLDLLFLNCVCRLLDQRTNR